jgi:N-acetylmuramoyl-L-alanine amidase
MLKMMLRNWLSILIILLSTSFGAVAQFKTIVLDAGHGYGRNGDGGPDGAPGAYSFEDDVCFDVCALLKTAIEEKFPDVKVVLTRPTRNYVSLTRRAEIANENNGDLFISIHCNSVDPITVKEQTGTKMVTKYRYKKVSRKKVKEAYEVEVPIYTYRKEPRNVTGAQTYIWLSRKTSDKVNAVRDTKLDTDTLEKTDTQIQAAVNVKKYFKRSVMLSKLIQDEFDAIGKKFGSTDAIYQRADGIYVLEQTAMPSVLVETGFISTPSEEDFLNSKDGQNQIVDVLIKAITTYKEKTQTTAEPQANKDVNNTTGAGTNK